MADNISGKLIAKLPAATAAEDTDIMILENATKTQKITWGTILNLIKTKLGIGTAANLQTTSKEIVGAVNELNSKLNVTVKYYGWLPDDLRGISTSEFRSAVPKGVSFYGTNTDIHLSDVNDKVSAYGTLINFKNGGYIVTLYSDVFGNLQTYNSQSKTWNKPFTTS